MKQVFQLCLTVFLCLGTQTWAEGPKPFPEFEAKRIKAPRAGLPGKRITVQIDPNISSNVAVLPTQEKSDSAAKPGKFAWFWDKVSPEAARASAGRLETALAALSGSNDKVPAPRLQALQAIAETRGVDILTATIGTRVSPALVLAVISVESSGRVDAESTAGAQGLMQLMPDTAARFGVKNSLVPTENIRGGVKYLDWLMQEFDGDPMLVLAGYNAGEGAVRSHAGVPPYAETRDYVPKVLAAFQIARGLCLTPPVLASDGCVFAAMN